MIFDPRYKPTLNQLELAQMILMCSPVNIENEWISNLEKIDLKVKTASKIRDELLETLHTNRHSVFENWGHWCEKINQQSDLKIEEWEIFTQEIDREKNFIRSARQICEAAKTPEEFRKIEQSYSRHKYVLDDFAKMCILSRKVALMYNDYETNLFDEVPVEQRRLFSVETLQEMVAEIERLCALAVDEEFPNQAPLMANQSTNMGHLARVRKYDPRCPVPRNPLHLSLDPLTKQRFIFITNLRQDIDHYVTRPITEASNLFDLDCCTKRNPYISIVNTKQIIESKTQELTKISAEFKASDNQREILTKSIDMQIRRNLTLLRMDDYEESQPTNQSIDTKIDNMLDKMLLEEPEDRVQPAP